MPKTARRWTEYPKSFLALLEHFRESGEEIRIDLPSRKARSTRQDFYRFRQALRVDVGYDTYVAELLEIADSLVFTVRPGTARGDEPTQLLIERNAIEEALRNANIPVRIVEEKSDDELSKQQPTSENDDKISSNNPLVQEIAKMMKLQDMGLGHLLDDKDDEDGETNE